MFDKLKEKLSSPFSSGEDRGVSPVIGVILMVAITVILAAVIGAFVLNLGDDLGNSAAPSAQLGLSDGTSQGELRIDHNGGDTLELDEFTLLVDGEVEDELPAGEELGPGEFVEVATNGEDEVDITIRHDPSGSVVAQGTVDVGSV